MIERRFLPWPLSIAVVSILGVAAASAQPTPLRIAIAEPFLSGKPKGAADIAADEFKDLLKKTTGLAGELTTKYGGMEIAKKLDDKQLDFGILYAHEFAWARGNYAELQPLLIAPGKHRGQRAYVIVHKKSDAKSGADLRGKKFDLAVGTKEHCLVYLDRLCGGKGPAEFFGSIAKSATPIEALNEVARAKVQATVVDHQVLEFYKEERGPVFENNLRILQQSELFPPAVIVHKKGVPDAATLKQFTDGLLKAHTVPEGREMMKSWDIDAFEPVREEFHKQLDVILKAYPPR